MNYIESWVKVRVGAVVLTPKKPDAVPYIVAYDDVRNVRNKERYAGSITIDLKAWPRDNPPKGGEHVEITELSCTGEGHRANCIRPISTPTALSKRI